MWFDIHKSTNGQYWWRAVGENSETLCHSEEYVDKVSAKHAIRVIKDDAASASVYDETGEKRGDHARERRITV
jgi:uncharacterized protein YegP (UPF0339 family)